jgi:hypothetical protein
MEAVPVHVGVMDSGKPGTVVTLQVDRLSAARRLGRAALRGLAVSGVGSVVTLVPLLHACGLFTVLLVGPLVAAFSLRASVLLGEGEVACPRCPAPVKIPARLAGWPARVHCGACGAMVELKPAPAEKPA